MKNKTASLLIIGNEILSGKTQDKNLNYIAKKLADMGITFVEVRVVRDIDTEIIYAVNELRKKYDYVFTSGGIGPTHDDITIDAIAKAFGVKVVMNETAKEKLLNYYKGRESSVNDARMKMAMFPEGSELIENPLTVAPGCKIENVFIFAGIPSIMQMMFDYASTYLQSGKKILSKTVSCDLLEGDIALELTNIQNEYSQTEIGSYPFIHEGKYATSLVVRSIDGKAVSNAAAAIEEMIKKHKGNFLQIN